MASQSAEIEALKRSVAALTRRIEALEIPTRVAAQVTGVSPLTVRLWGDTGDVEVSLQNDDIAFVVGDKVVADRIGTQLAVAYRLGSA